MSKSGKHPKGLYFLFFAEMWERFGYYLMIGIFLLYMIGDKAAGGMGMERANASDIFGTFIALVFLTPFLGGLLADRKLGYRTSITIGGIMMGIGYCMLGIPGDFYFYTSLALIILGNGFFKPNISTLLGNLYSEEQYKDKKDDGYNIFYMGINIGAFVCNFFGAYLLINYGWGQAFMGAGIGMFIGVIIFWIGVKHYKHVDVLKPVQPEDDSLGKIFGVTILPALVAGLLGWLIPKNIFGSDSTDAFIFGAMPVAWFYFSLYKKANTTDKRPIAAMLSVFAVVIVFWAVFKQNGTALTTWAELYTDRTMPAAVAPSAKKLQMSEEISGKTDTIFLTDDQFRKIKDEAGQPIKGLGQNNYFKNELPSKIPSTEKESVSLVSTNLFQSINPGWVILLTPLVVLFFTFLRRRGREPSTPAKIAWGLVISALSTLVMVAAVYFCGNGESKASAWWLIASYGVVTVGELFLSPIGLSFVSKLSPPRLTALMMGGWFLSTSIGNKLSGILATMWDNYDNKMLYFLVNFILLTIAAIAIFSMLKWLKAIIAEHSGK
ncbi:MAG: peptide MFS transporter [Bacteroidota bacterium]|nr:peptide MFS transporter [Bacteroidota bacterium]